MDTDCGSLKGMNDLQCFAHGHQLALELSVRQLRRVLDGLIAGHLELRERSAGDAMLGPDKHIIRAAEMLGCMETITPSAQPQVQA